MCDRSICIGNVTEILSEGSTYDQLIETGKSSIP